MKTSKKIFAALLAVMMIVMMIPITASAADNNTITITLNPYAGDDANESGTADGAYTMGIYKVETLMQQQVSTQLLFQLPVFRMLSMLKRLILRHRALSIYSMA